MDGSRVWGAAGSRHAGFHSESWNVQTDTLTYTLNICASLTEKLKSLVSCLHIPHSLNTETSRTHWSGKLMTLVPKMLIINTMNSEHEVNKLPIKLWQKSDNQNSWRDCKTIQTEPRTKLCYSEEERNGDHTVHNRMQRFTGLFWLTGRLGNWAVNHFPVCLLTSSPSHLNCCYY